MKDELLSIGKMAELNGVTIAALRLYDRMDLLKPRYTDPETGYRYYDLEQNARLDLITYMKELGMSLSEIGDILCREDIMLVEAVLSRKNEQLHEQMRAIKAQHDAVERAIQSIERYRRAPMKDMIVLEYIDQRSVMGIPCTENFYAYDIKSYEKVLMELRKWLVDQGLSQVHTYNIGTTIRREDFEAGSLIADRIFAFTGRHVPDGCRPYVIDSGMYACIYTDSYDEESACAETLRQFCLDKDYQIAGDYICEVMTEFNVFDSEQRSMYLKLQVPLNFR